MVFPPLHAGYDTTEVDTHRRFLRGCIFGRGCESPRLHLSTSLGGAPFTFPTSLRARVVFSGGIAKAFTVKGVHLTKGARAAIEAAGGRIDA